MQNSSILKPRFYQVGLVLSLVALGIVARFLPHPPNFVPITAIALFSGAKLNSRFAGVIPLAIMIISDLVLGLHDVIFYTWGAFLLIALLGRYGLGNSQSWGKILGITFTASVAFFLITNFGVWAATNLYPHNFAGLVQSYAMAVPFFKSSLIGNFFYTTVIFSLYEVAMYVAAPMLVFRAIPMDSSSE